MQTFLYILLYGAFGALLLVLGYGLFNMTRRDARQASRSNQLMRWRIGIQALCILLLVIIGLYTGVMKLG